MSVVHEKKDDGTIKAKVGGVSALMKGQTCPPRVNDLRLYDHDKPDPAVYEALPEWVRKIIDRAVSPAQRFEEPAGESSLPDHEDVPF